MRLSLLRFEDAFQLVKYSLSSSRVVRGKSTLFNVLTEAGVLESASTFATIDPNSGNCSFLSRRKILLSDTVDFIRKGPSIAF
jgi:hypothetical protein